MFFEDFYKKQRNVQRKRENERERAKIYSELQSNLIHLCTSLYIWDRMEGA